MGGGSKTSIKVTMFLFTSTVVLVMKMMQLQSGSNKVFLKALSLRLNMRPYSKLDKEVADFRECKDGLTTPHDTRYSYLGAGISQE